MSMLTPGIYFDLAWDDYCAIDAANNGSLSQLRRSPRHFKFSPPRDETPSLRLGTLTHAAILEPMEVLRRYVVLPDFARDERNQTGDGRRSSARTAWVREQEELFRVMQAGKAFVDQDELDAMIAMAAAVSSVDAARDILQQAGRSEVTIVWHDEASGLLCKGRIDRLGPRTIGDLKTCVDLKKFQHSYRDFGYYRQMAFYADGYAALTGQHLTPWIVAVEKTPPYCVQAAPVHPEDLAQGRAEYREMLTLYAECKRLNEWPGPPSPESWRLPEWARRGKNEVTHFVETDTEIVAI